MCRLYFQQFADAYTAVKHDQYRIDQPDVIVMMAAAVRQAAVSVQDFSINI